MMGKVKAETRELEQGKTGREVEAETERKEVKGKQVREVSAEARRGKFREKAETVAV